MKLLANPHSRTCFLALRLAREANPNLADCDGWTALTYASRCGSPEAVQALLEKGAGEEKNDGGRASKEALRVQHNAAARALLRAGFGPAPQGTFALEGAVRPEEGRPTEGLVHGDRTAGWRCPGSRPREERSHSPRRLDEAKVNFLDG